MISEVQLLNANLRNTTLTDKQSLKWQGGTALQSELSWHFPYIC